MGCVQRFLFPHVHRATVRVAKGPGPDGARPAFREVDLSRATVRVTLRYRVVRPPKLRRTRVWLAEDPDGQAAVCLPDDAGVIDLCLRVPQRVYVALEDSRLRLDLWVVEWVALRRSEC